MPAIFFGHGNPLNALHDNAYTQGWAVRFETKARALLRAGDFAPLVNYETLGRDALLSVPTPEHYLPLLYVIAQRRNDEPISFPVEGFDGGSISMLAVQLG
jgi:4,5-DOPA dioxygenase extradiol